MVLAYMLALVAAGAAPAGQASAGDGPKADAPAPADVASLRQELQAERAALDEQQRELNATRQHIEALEARLEGRAPPAAPTSEVATAKQTSTVPLPVSPPPAPPVAGGVQSVGEAPTDQRQVQVAVLDEQGGIITKAGRMTVEGDLEYARTDNNSVIFRGTAALPAVLIGVFDINQSRDDFLTAAAVGRLGVTNRLEINARAPFVYRSDKTVLAPVTNPSEPNAGQIDHPVKAGKLGDVEFGARYQITNGHNGSPYLIAGVQAVAPTGTNPFTVPRDDLGNALKPSTGGGFWGITPNLTAILPTDPAVLFGTIGYTYNAPRTFNAIITQSTVNGVTTESRIDRVWPGGEPSASAGVALQLNPRASISFGYAHTWVFGTKTRFSNIDSRGQTTVSTAKTRDLQLGRLLFGLSYRVNQRTTINWSVEAGVTNDAPDVRTSLRIPLTFDLF